MVRSSIKEPRTTSSGKRRSLKMLWSSGGPRSHPVVWVRLTDLSLARKTLFRRRQHASPMRAMNDVETMKYTRRPARKVLASRRMYMMAVNSEFSETDRSSLRRCPCAPCKAFITAFWLPYRRPTPIQSEGPQRGNWGAFIISYGRSRRAIHASTGLTRTSHMGYGDLIEQTSSKVAPDLIVDEL